MAWKNDEYWVKKCMEIRVKGKRPVGRPIKTWLENVEAYMAELEIDMKTECYEEEDQPYRKTEYKSIIIMCI